MEPPRQAGAGPRIQYAKTTDGVSIAYWKLGEGTPFVVMPSLPTSHIQLEWKMPESRRWFERLAEKKTLIRYDGRGSGLSERNVTEYSHDAHVSDLEAVVDRLGLERFTLFALHHSGPVAIMYAARHPERVSRLILWCVWLRGADWAESPVFRALRASLDIDWETFTETMAHAMFGWSGGEEAQRVAAFYRESTTPELWRVAWRMGLESDPTPLLPQVQCPTLVLHRQVPELDVSVARGLASRIPDARLVILEGTLLMPYRGDMEAVLSSIEEFLGEGEEAESRAAAPGGLVTILFTDMVSSTAVTQRLGDAKAQELVRAHNAIVREALGAHGGNEIKHTGDGIMASFPSASGALECAIAIQKAVEQQAETPLRVHIGLNAGEPVAEERDLFGTAVQLARRICDHAEAGEILASNVVRELAAGKGFLFADVGERELRGFEDPVRLYEVRWREEEG